MMKFQTIYPRDIIAFVLIVFCFVLKLCNIDGTISMIMVGLVGYYFSKRVYEENNKK